LPPNNYPTSNATIRQRICSWRSGFAALSLIGSGKPGRGRRAVDSFEEEQRRFDEFATALTGEARLALRALSHRSIKRIDIFETNPKMGPTHILVRFRLTYT
jgi:hypothetical protein